MKALGGFLHLDGQRAAAADLSALNQALVYQPARFGPDSDLSRSDAQVSGPLALGATRWGRTPDALIEPQLWTHQDTGCAAVVDARLSNRAELCRQLAAHDQASNAELVLLAWLRWSEACIEELRGDFAFAIHDPRSQVLFCGRDHVGVKPLYYCHLPGKLFAFASRASALLALPGVPKDLDHGRIADTLVNPLELASKTCSMYRAVQRLEPAHVLSLAPSGLRLRRYWRPEPGLVSPVPSDDRAWIEAFTGVMETAVASHLQGPGNVGCMLSGGLDSSSLAVIARDQLANAGRGALTTFSSVDTAPSCAETAAIRAVLAQGGFNPTQVGPDEVRALADELRAAIYASEEPFDFQMTLIHAQYLLAARAGMVAVLDGIDADLLLGYGSTLARQLRHGHWLSAWRNARGIQANFGIPAWKPLLSSSRSALTPDWLRQAKRHLYQDSQHGEALKDSLIAPDFARAVCLPDRFQDPRQWSAPRLAHSAPEEAADMLAGAITLSGFERYHRVAAWHGVEPRHPFNDRAVMELCINLPDRQRMRDGWTKYILRAAMQGRLPDGVCWRKGKEHLGWNITRQVLGTGPSPLQDLADRRALVAPYLSKPKLDALLAKSWPTLSEEEQSNVLPALALAQWLEHQQHHTLSAR